MHSIFFVRTNSALTLNSLFFQFSIYKTPNKLYFLFRSRTDFSNSLFFLKLKKTTANSKTTWTAGCTTNCSGQPACKATAQTECHLECCNATQTSCLWLNGTLNFPSHATRGPHLNTECIVSLLGVLAFTLLL